MKKLPEWLHKKNFTAIEIQGTIKGGAICPCGEKTFEETRCVLCKQESITPDGNYEYLSVREERERQRFR